MSRHPHFGTSYRRDPAGPPDLKSRIDAQVRERIEDAVDMVCLEAMVVGRQAARRPAPVADSAEDRAEFEAGVRAFLERLEAEIVPGRPRSRARAGGAVTALIQDQVALAKELPDYWQRFEAARQRHLDGPPPASGGERRGLLGRLLGHG